MYEKFVDFVRDLYGTKEFIPLHEPVFLGREKEFLSEAIESTYVSSVGEYVDRFEEVMCDFTGAKYAIATVNGTAALHLALKISDVDIDTEVITQSLTFVATVNAIRYCGASPVFVDVDRSTFGLSPRSLASFLNEFCEMRDDGKCWNTSTNRPVIACVPMHTFGMPCYVEEITRICDDYGIVMLEDAAESLGSSVMGQHTGTFSRASAISFNGNKIITTGGGGMLLTDNEALARRSKHLSTVARIGHENNFIHDDVGFNYRLPNLNAAVGLAQMEQLEYFVRRKRALAEAYKTWGIENDMRFAEEREGVFSNFWLNAAIMDSKTDRDIFIAETNDSHVMTRPVWTPMHELSMNRNFQKHDLTNTNWLSERVVNVPSSVIVD